MFNRKNKTKYSIIEIHGEAHVVDDATYEYIQALKHFNDHIKAENDELHREIDRIKPVIESGKLEPALSRYCHDCKFVVKDGYSGSILGCCINSVCENRTPKED